MLPAVLSFVPRYVLIVSRQTSALPLLCPTAGCLALRVDRKWWAGRALRSLVLKPHFGVAVTGGTLVCLEWHLAAALTQNLVALNKAVADAGTPPVIAVPGQRR